MGENHEKKPGLSIHWELSPGINPNSTEAGVGLGTLPNWGKGRGVRGDSKHAFVRM